MQGDPTDGPHATPADRPRCGARRRDGNPCTAFPVRGKDRCRMHGGATPIKHGLRSKYGPPPRIAERIAALEHDSRVLDLRHVGAHLYAVVEEILGALEDEERLSTEQAEALLPVLRELRKTATDYRRLALDTRFVDLVEARSVLATGLQAVLRHVPEDRMAVAIADFDRVTAGETDAIAGPATGPH